MSKISIHLSRAAAEKARKPDEVRAAAIAAYQAAGAGDIFFRAFKSNGQQFALSSRTIIEVDWLPNRVPDRVIRAKAGNQPSRKG